MVKHRIMKKRLKTVAKELGVFSTQEIVAAINRYPNRYGKRVARSPQINTYRCALFLRMDPEIHVKEKYTHGANRTIWEYKEEKLLDWGEEE